MVANVIILGSPVRARDGYDGYDKCQLCYRSSCEARDVIDEQNVPNGLGKLIPRLRLVRNASGCEKTEPITTDVRCVEAAWCGARSAPDGRWDRGDTRDQHRSE